MLRYENSSLAGGSPAPAPGLYGIPCAVLRCGTSRTVFVDGSSCPEEGGSEISLISLLAGENPGDGLGGDHYQFNKIAVIYPGGGDVDFTFRFYQLQLRERRLIGGLECANAAAGAGLVAILSGVADVSRRASLRALNLGTGQLLELVPLEGGSESAVAWTVRFLGGHGSAIRLPAPDSHTLVHPDGRALEFWVVERGNLFVLANAEPSAADPELTAALAAHGARIAETMGCRPEKAAAPKVVLYSVVAPGGVETAIRAACFFDGQMHHSLPGSAAMCLSSFLTMSCLSSLEPADSEGWMAYRIENPGGELVTRVHWKAGEQGIEIISTEFDTSARLLFWGVAPVRQAAGAP